MIPLSVRLAMLAVLMTGTLSASTARAGDPFPDPARAWQSGTGGSAIAGSMVVTTEPGWRELWRDLKPTDSPPAFDPDTEVGIVIFLGRQKDGEKSVRVLSGETSDGFFVITYDDMAPPPSSEAQPAPSARAPYMVFVMARPPFPILVQEAGDAEVNGPEP